MTTTMAYTDALAVVAQGAAARDREPHPAFPADAIAALEDAGVLAGGLPFSEQLVVVRDVARADAAVARIVDELLGERQSPGQDARVLQGGDGIGGEGRVRLPVARGRALGDDG